MPLKVYYFNLIDFFSGGKLWDYILSYNSDAPVLKTYSLEEICIPKTPEVLPEVPIIESTEAILDLIEEIPQKVIPEEIPNFAPSFDDLNVDMDVLDLVSCSKKLLNSVSTTLKHTKESPEEPVNEIELLEENIIPESHSNENITRFLRECTIVQKSIQKSILNTKTLLPEGSIRQWARELIVAIDSLHSNGVILG